MASKVTQPGWHGAAAPAACSQPASPSFPVGLLCAPQTCVAVPMYPLPLLALCGQFPPQCWMLEARSTAAPQPAGAMGTTLANFCTIGAVFANPPVDEGERDMGRNILGGASRTLWRAWWGLAPMAPLFWLFLPPCPVPPAVSAPWLTGSRLHSWDGEELEAKLPSCRRLSAPAPCWLLPAQPLAVIRQLPGPGAFPAARGSAAGLYRGPGGPCDRGSSGCAARLLCPGSGPAGSAGAIVCAGLPALRKRCPVSFPHIPLRRPCLTPCGPGSLREPPDPPAPPVTLPTPRPEEPHGLGVRACPGSAGTDTCRPVRLPRPSAVPDPPGAAAATAATPGTLGPAHNARPHWLPGPVGVAGRDRPEPALPAGPGERRRRSV